MLDFTSAAIASFLSSISRMKKGHQVLSRPRALEGLHIGIFTEQCLMLTAPLSLPQAASLQRPHIHRIG